ncbi:unnamed protein product [Urochloa decumbens]|uniref:Bowman-Birk serine protease inhibitors family domain-containing protein n=1 Tax=Urochloa decumbens TaxID=240449 RepID=A0ABC8ZAW6_9POAL
MGKQVASILLMLSLEALLLVVGLSTGDTGGVIRLPSNTATASGESVMARRMQLDDGERPWKCCNLQLCTKSIPALCVCRDQLEHCSDACKECDKARGSGPPLRYICKDAYRGNPAPRCPDGQAGNRAIFVHNDVDDDLVTAIRTATNGAAGEQRPWECCDFALCTIAQPLTCRCYDRVDRCSSACKLCEQMTYSHQYSCADWYQGDLGPWCHNNKDASRSSHYGGIAAERQEATAMAVDDDDKTGGGDKKRSWGPRRLRGSVGK